MLFDVEFFLFLFIAFVGVMLIYNARWVFKNKVKIESENSLVRWVKIVAYFIVIFCLYVIYRIKQGGI